MNSKPNLAYCDYIAMLIHRAVYTDITEEPTSLIGDVGKIKLDLHPKGGYLLSTKKEFLVADINNKNYKITVEEVPDGTETV